MARRKKRERRKPGTGYTTQAPAGTWNAYYPKQPTGYHVRKGFGSRQAAEDWLDSLVTQHEQKLDVSSGQMRVGDWIDRWIEREQREREWKAKMTADVLFKLGYVKPFIGDKALADVRPDDTDAMIDELARALAPTTIRQIRNYIYQVFESAVKRRYIVYNPVIKPERRKRPKQQEPERMNVAQARVLLRAAESSFYALAWWLILVLGLRAGEACGLRWGDIDLDQAIIHIDQEVTTLNGRPHKDLPKNDKKRVLPIPRALIPLFRLHYQLCLGRSSQAQRRGYGQEHGLVFPGRGGRPMATTSLWHQLRRLADACKMPPMKTHNLRHTAGAFYTSLGCPENVVGAILGHAPNITGHYAPPDVETMRPWVEQVYRQISGDREQGRVEKQA